MAFAEIHFRGGAIHKDATMYAILPEQAEQAGPYPVFYLLHGLSDDHTIWHRRTRIEWYVRDLPVIVVMPDGGRAFYCDAVDGPAYERHLIEDVIGWVDRFLPTIAERRGRVIGGLSMGGYGAMKLALKHPEMFCSVVAHSGCHAIVRRLIEHHMLPDHEELTPELLRIYGPSPSLDEDPFALAERIDRSRLPAIRFNCGTEDFLLDHNREFHAHLERLGIPHEYEESPGEHTWDYWDLHIQETLAFHCRALGIQPLPAAD
jgi:S-formylglutathione hydrolase FrmB